MKYEIPIENQHKEDIEYGYEMEFQPQNDIENSNEIGNLEIDKNIIHEKNENKNIGFVNVIATFWISYTSKFYGIKNSKHPKRLPLSEMLYNTLLSFIGILLISVTDYWYLIRTFNAGDTGVYMLIGSFAATAVLVFDLYSSPVSQPKNVIGGHVVSAFVGVSIRYICQHLTISQWIQAPLAVCFSIFFMDFLEVTHPPGGATALISVIGGDSVNNLGFGLILTCLGAAIISIVVATIGNNLVPTRQYPTYWY